jgi:hypothetical protein
LPRPFSAHAEIGAVPGRARSKWRHLHSPLPMHSPATASPKRRRPARAIPACGCPPLDSCRRSDAGPRNPAWNMAYVPVLFPRPHRQSNAIMRTPPDATLTILPKTVRKCRTSVK